MIIFKVFIITIGMMTIAGIGYGLSLAYRKIIRSISNTSGYSASR